MQVKLDVETLRKWVTTIGAIVAAILAGMGGLSTTPRPLQTPPANPTSPSSPPKQEEPKPQTLQAIGQIQFGSAGCTATIIGPRRPDGRWNVLTAAHCVRGQASAGKMKLKDGTVLVVDVVTVKPTPDLCWLVTRDNIPNLPFALLAEKNPEPGTKIWHAGYGIHIPGNREDGVVIESQNSGGQTRFTLSVSSGDSGGGIAIDSTGKIVSCVCCTDTLSGRGNVWGASVESIRNALTFQTQHEFQWTPLDIPIRKLQDDPKGETVEQGNCSKG